MDNQPSLPGLPLGRSEFQVLRSRHELYIDKTRYLAEMVNESPYVFLARPRRFGKTLFVSMAEQAFRGQRSLFTDCYLGNDSAWDWQARPVLRLNLSRVQGDSPRELMKRLDQLVRRTQQRLGGPATTRTHQPDPEDLVPDQDLLDLIENLHDAHGSGVVVLVDEYDAPITHLLGRTHQLHYPDQPIDKHGIMEVLRQFFSVLKEAETFLHFTFLTGISRFARSGVFSALNNLTDISHDSRFSAVTGITESELDQDLDPYMQTGAVHLGMTEKELRSELRDYYNGYQFGGHQQAVYNPFSLLGCLAKLRDPLSAQDIGRWGFPALWSESGTPQLLVRMLQTGRYDLSQWSENPIQALTAVYDPETPSLEALLCQTGYLTLKESDTGDLVLAAPNLEVGQDFVTSMLQGYLREPDDFARHIGGRRTRLQDALAQQDWCTFFGEIDSVFHESIPYDLLQVENNFHVVFHLICALLQVGRCTSELHTVRGRADMILDWPTGAYGVAAEQVILFELKVNENPLVALDQISEREYWTRLTRHQLPVYGMGVNFRSQRQAGESVCTWTDPYMFYNPAVPATRHEIREAYRRWRHEQSVD